LAPVLAREDGLSNYRITSFIENPNGAPIFDGVQYYPNKPPYIPEFPPLLVVSRVVSSMFMMRPMAVLYPFHQGMLDTILIRRRVDTIKDTRMLLLLQKGEMEMGLDVVEEMAMTKMRKGISNCRRALRPAVILLKPGRGLKKGGRGSGIGGNSILIRNKRMTRMTRS
jgi:hypothetical protein